MVYRMLQLTRRGACPWDCYLIPDEFLKYGLGGDGGESNDTGNTGWRCL